MSSPMTSNNVNGPSTTETESTPAKTEATSVNTKTAPTQMITADVYTNIAYLYSIKDPILAPYYHKLQKITNGCWQQTFCVNVNNAKACEAFLAAYEERFGTLD